ncbi:hypothetical protein BYT27DRAFT_7174103 [Phlegmacium glaucopus]|nr:hypothetical protein BYT27DRAFT_7174103 [Phlegmacium glaucopus]
MPDMSDAVLARREVRATNSAKRKELADKLRLEGNKMYNNGDYIEAANNYAKAVNIHGGPKPVLMSNLAMTYLKLELYEDAEWAATIALTHDPRNIKARFRRAMARKEKGMDSRHAISDLLIIINEDPTCKDAKTEIQGLLGPGEEYDALPIDYDDYPGYHEEPEEFISDSETSEYRHTGNNIPCWFHNREGCVRASNCKFSHAPDDRSVRDELGRNVCLNSLLDDCTFGSRKCFYSHDRTYLPPGGWWNDPEKTTIKSMMVKSNKKMRRGTREKDTFLAHLKASFERAAQKVPKNPTLTPQPRAPEPFVKPFVLLLSFENEDFFAEIHAHVLTALRDKLQVIQALTHRDALKHLSSPGLAGVFVTDPGIVHANASAVVNKLVAYVKNGGSAVFGGCLSTFVIPTDLNRFFKNAWGLDWKQGSYFRTTFTLNPSNELAKRNPSMATSYSMKAVHIACISPEMALYAQREDSNHASPRTEAPAVCTRVGRGLVSFLGDVNAETSSTNTVLAMLGLLDAPNGPLSPSSPTSPPEAEPTPMDPSKSSLPKTHGNKKDQSTKTSATQKPSTSSPKPDSTPTTPVSSQSTEEKFILIIVLKHKDTFMQKWKSQISALREKIQVHVADTTSSVLTHLASPYLDGVYAADEGVFYPQILSKLVDYTKSGGAVVVGGVLPSMADGSQVAKLFSAFDLSWRKGSSVFFHETLDLNLDHDIAKRHTSIPYLYSLKAVTLKNVDRDTVLYITALDSDDDQAPDPLEAPILHTRVGAGSLGYIGDTNAAPESTPVLLAMLDLLDRPPSIIPDTLKFVMTLSFSLVDLVEEHFGDFFQKLDERVEVLHGLSNARIIDLLSSPDLLGVFITDSSITDHKNRYLLSKLVEYSKNGGTIIFGAFFCGNIEEADMRPFFFDNWGLSWELVSGRVNATVSLNSKNSLVMKNSDLPVSFYLSAHYLKGITQSTAVYVAQNRPHVWKPNRKLFQSAILYAGVQKGHVGYIGMKDLDETFISIFCAMLGIP